MRPYRINLFLEACLAAALLTLAIADDSISPVPSGDKQIEATTATSPNSINNTIATTTTTTTTTRKPKVQNDCPQECQCIDRRMNCDNANLKSLPLLPRSSSIVEFSFKNNMLQSVNLNNLPTSIEALDLSNNSIKSIDRPLKKSDTLNKLKSLNLTNNQFESIANLTSWKMPQISSLDISRNPIKEINLSNPGTLKSLKTLRMDSLANLTFLNESTFSFFNALEALSLSRSLTKLSNLHLPDKIFSQNPRLKVLDLSYNNLPDVPNALRYSGAIEELRLDGNNMTTLRPSDFINRRALTKLYISECPLLDRIESFTFGNMDNLTILIVSNNHKLNHISVHAFAPIQVVDQVDAEINNTTRSDHTYELIDLSGNKFTTLSDPTKFVSLSFQRILLNDNPWHCDCNLCWLSSMPATTIGPLMHCKTPAMYKDMEVSQFIQTIDCDPAETNYQRVVLASFLIFLLVLAIAVFLQKANLDFCRRFQKDQYGTIYYTKASFPTEQV